MVLSMASSFSSSRQASPGGRGESGLIETPGGRNVTRGGRAERRAGVIDPQSWGRALRTRHPQKTADHVAAALGAPARTVEKWLAGESMPSAIWLGPLLMAYGPSLFAEVLGTPPAWLAEAARAERQAELEAEHARIMRELDALRGSRVATAGERYLCGEGA